MVSQHVRPEGINISFLAVLQPEAASTHVPWHSSLSTKESFPWLPLPALVLQHLKDCWVRIPEWAFPNIFLMAMLLGPWAHPGSWALWHGDKTLKIWLKSLQKRKAALGPWGSLLMESSQAWEASDPRDSRELWLWELSHALAPGMGNFPSGHLDPGNVWFIFSLFSLGLYWRKLRFRNLGKLFLEPPDVGMETCVPQTVTFQVHRQSRDGGLRQHGPDHHSAALLWKQSLGSEISFLSKIVGF